MEHATGASGSSPGRSPVVGDVPSGGDSCDQGWDDALATVMARVAAGEAGAVFALRERFADELARTVRGLARRRGVTLGPDDVEDLVTDAALELAHLAGSWRPDGAPPWVWARARLAAVVDRHLGQWTRPLDDAALARAEQSGPVPAGPISEPEALVVLERLAGRDPAVALLVEALERVASERDRELFVEALLQASLGDRSPAVTVGALLGVSPEVVRQQHRRVRRRVGQLAATDERYAELAGLAVVA